MNPGRVRKRVQLLLSFLSLQAAAQLVSVLAGLVVVRTLPIPDFAVYTLVTALQATFAVISDSGISSMLISRAGRLHTDRARLGELVASARQLRRSLEVLVLILGAPILWVWLRDKHISTWEFIALAITVAVTLHLQISASIFGTVPLVLLEVEKVQMAQLAGGLARLTAVAGALAVFPRALPALCASTAGTAVQAWFTRRYASEHIDLMASAHPEDLKSLKTMVRAQLLNGLYYAFSSQLTVWLIGFAGTTRAVAEVGALGRLGSIIALGQSALGMLVVPRLARVQSVKVFRQRYLATLSFTICVAAALVASAFLAPAAFLWVLGPAYAGLRAELPLAILSGALYLISTTIFLLNNSKAWIEQAWIAVPLVIGVQLTALFFLKVNTVHGAILFGLLASLPPLVVNSTIGALKMTAWARVEKTEVRSIID